MSSLRSLRWVSLHPNRFGRLQDEVNFPENSLNVIIGPNEAGKSTLSASLLASLYGLKGRKKEDIRPDAKQFKPWTGGDFRVDFSFSLNDDIYTVIRDFDKRSFSVMKNGVLDVTRDFVASRNEDHLGESITGGLSAGAFGRTFFVAQEDASRVSTPHGLVDKIHSTVTSGPSDSTVRGAIDKLHLAKDKVKVSAELGAGLLKSSTVKKRLGEDLKKTIIELTSLRNEEVAYDQLLVEISDKEDARKNLESDLDSIKKALLVSERTELAVWERELWRLARHSAAEKGVPSMSLNRWSEVCGVKRLPVLEQARGS